MEITPRALSVYGLSCIEPRTILQQSVGRKVALKQCLHKTATLPERKQPTGVL